MLSSEVGFHHSKAVGSLWLLHGSKKVPSLPAHHSEVGIVDDKAIPSRTNNLIRLDNLIKDTSRELGNLDKANRELLERTARAVDTLDVRLRAVEDMAEAGGGGDHGRKGRDSKTRGYLQFKSTIPESLGNEPTK